LLGGEVASMVMTEAVARLCPDVIGDSESMIDESYSIQESMSSLEYPQYTRPQDVE
jgi:tRNA (guanine37-N1)-methyltransferase